MKAMESIDMKGRLTLRLYDRAGQLADYREADNLIVLDGRRMVAQQLAGVTATPLVITHLGVGIGTKETTSDDSKLQIQVIRKKINKVLATDITAYENNTKMKLLVSADLDFNEANADLTEAGLFTADTGGTMYNRVVFPAIKKTNGFKLSLVWEIIF